MSIYLVTSARQNTPGGVSQYWTRLLDALAKHGIEVIWTNPKEWKGGNAASDLVIVDNQDACIIEPKYAVIAVQHGCAGEHGWRRNHMPTIALAARQAQAGRRKRTFWVGCSNWASAYCAKWQGVHADRVVRGAVDVNRFFPGERQYARSASRPVVLHHAVDNNKGVHIIDSVAEELGSGFDVRKLHAPPDQVADAMRDADIWLGLSMSEGLPTVVMEAMSTNLVVVASDVGVLWEYGSAAGNLPLKGANGFYGWLNPAVSCCIYPWQLRTHPAFIASLVKRAWKERERFQPRDYALEWFSMEQFAQKWVETIHAAMVKFDLKGAPTAPPGPPKAKAKPKPRPADHSVSGPQGRRMPTTAADRMARK